MESRLLCSILVFALWNDVSARPKQLEPPSKGPLVPNLSKEESLAIRAILAKALEHFSDRELLATLESSLYLRLRLCLKELPNSILPSIQPLTSLPPPTSHPVTTKGYSTERVNTGGPVGTSATSPAQKGTSMSPTNGPTKGAITTIPTKGPTTSPKQAPTTKQRKDVISNVVDEDEPMVGALQDVLTEDLDEIQKVSLNDEVDSVFLRSAQEDAQLESNDVELDSNRSELDRYRDDEGEFESIITIGGQATDDQGSPRDAERNNWVGIELFKKPQATDVTMNEQKLTKGN